MTKNRRKFQKCAFILRVEKRPDFASLFGSQEYRAWSAWSNLLLILKMKTRTPKPQSRKSLFLNWSQCYAPKTTQIFRNPSFFNLPFNSFFLVSQFLRLSDVQSPTFYYLKSREGFWKGRSTRFSFLKFHFSPPLHCKAKLTEISLLVCSFPFVLFSLLILSILLSNNGFIF